ncbi:MAG: AhpC/TSA family protein, partial [Deinococcales bacterium]|nr:AhpC/TSA family protein [Chitinophagaceae bacterium]
ISLTLLACKQTSKTPKDSYIVTGKLKGTNVGEAVVLQKLLMGAKADTTLVAADGNFTFTGTVTEPTAVAIFTKEAMEEQSIIPLTLFVEDGKTTITGDKLTMNVASVTGGKSNNDLQKFQNIMQTYYKKMKPIGDSMRVFYDGKNMAAIQPLQAQYLQYERQQKTEIMQLAKANPKSYASAFFAYQFNSYASDLEGVEKAYNNLDGSIQVSFFGKKLKEVAEALKTTGIGGKAPNFSLQTPDNTTIALSSLKGKYVLIDFWASWCGPCRQENPNVVKAFNQFKNKNFTILGVSLDEDKAAWQQAIKKDNLTWQHVSDLKGWNSEVAALYGVKGIPANYLLDTDGKIIAKDLRGNDLIIKLSEVIR